MIETMLNSVYSGVSDNAVQAWARDLAADIKTGVYASSAAGWINCSSITQPATKRSIASIAPLACPLQWARESNGYDCVCHFTIFFVHHCHSYSAIVVGCVLVHRRIGPLQRHLFCQCYTRCQCLFYCCFSC